MYLIITFITLEISNFARYERFQTYIKIQANR